MFRQDPVHDNEPHSIKGLRLIALKDPSLQIMMSYTSMINNTRSFYHMMVHMTRETTWIWLRTVVVCATTIRVYDEFTHVHTTIHAPAYMRAAMRARWLYRWYASKSKGKYRGRRVKTRRKTPHAGRRGWVNHPATLRSRASVTDIRKRSYRKAPRWTMSSLRTLATRGLRLVLGTSLTLMRVTMRWGLTTLETTMVKQGLVETLLLTPMMWEITLVILAIAIAEEGQNTRGTTCDNANDSTGVHSVGGGNNTNAGNIEGVRVLGVALDGLTGDVKEYLWDDQIIAAIYLRDVTQPDVAFPIENERRTLTEFMELAAKGTRRCVTRGLRTARDKGERKIYILARNLHWRVLLVDSAKKRLYTFDPMGHAFKDSEMEATLRVFPDHDHVDLDLKLQSDAVNCGAWVVWMSWIWLTEEARHDPDFRDVVRTAMLSGRPVVRDLREIEGSGGHDGNIQAMVQIPTQIPTGTIGQGLAKGGPGTPREDGGRIPP